MVEILFKLSMSTLILKVQQPLARDPGIFCKRNRCVENETWEEKILKALEHHQTRKTPTHKQKKLLRSSQASLNGSFPANCTTQPPAPTEQHHFFSPSKSTRALTERVGVHALFRSDLFILLPTIHPLSAVISTLRVTSPRLVRLSSPQRPSCRVKHNKNKHCIWNQKDKTYNSLDGRILAFGCKVHCPNEAVSRVTQTIEFYSICVSETQCLHPLLDTDEDLVATLNHQEEVNLPDS